MRHPPGTIPYDHLHSLGIGCAFPDQMRWLFGLTKVLVVNARWGTYEALTIRAFCHLYESILLQKAQMYKLDCKSFPVRAIYENPYIVAIGGRNETLLGTLFGLRFLENCAS